MKKEKLWLKLGNLCLILTLVGLTPFVAAAADSAPPIKVGVLVPQTGPLTELGNDIKYGLTMAFDEVQWKIAGREVKMIIEDTEAKPNVALQKAKKLVESDRVDMLAGVVHSGVAMAVKGYVNEQKIPIIVTCAVADAITKDNPSKYLFRTGTTAEMEALPIAAYAYRELGSRKVYTFAQDYVTGHDQTDSFKGLFEKLGGKVIGEAFPPFGTTDFAPYLAKVKDVDAVWAFEPGSDGIQFVKQYGEYGLKKKINHLLGVSSTFKGYQIEVQKEAAVGGVYSTSWGISLNTPENQKFVKAYQKMGRAAPPDDVLEQAYIGGQVIIKGITGVKGNTKDVPRLLESLAKVKLVAPSGPFEFDSNRNSIRNIYISKVVMKEGKYTSEEIYTFKNVRQNWTP